MFQVSFERGEGDALIGGPPSPEQDSNENVISVFVCKVVDPDNPFGTSVSQNLTLLVAMPGRPKLYIYLMHELK